MGFLSLEAFRKVSESVRKMKLYAFTCKDMTELIYKLQQKVFIHVCSSY